jgi:hypothetical protein
MDVSVLEDRLAELRDELVIGERALQELAVRRDELMATVLRINGAVRVLEELLATTAEPSRTNTAPWTAAS